MKPYKNSNRIVTRDEFNALLDYVEAIKPVGGVGVLTTQTGNGTAIRVSNDGFAVVRITGHTLISGASNKWEYAYCVVVFNSTTSAFVDTATTGVCYNLCEVMNSSSGLQGNGVNLSNLTGTFAIIPIPTNSILKMASFGGSNWVEYQNAVDGACS